MSALMLFKISSCRAVIISQVNAARCIRYEIKLMRNQALQRVLLTDVSSEFKSSDFDFTKSFFFINKFWYFCASL